MKTRGPKWGGWTTYPTKEKVIEQPFIAHLKAIIYDTRKWKRILSRSRLVIQEEKNC